MSPPGRGRLALIGGGEHARVVAEAARAAGWEIAGYVAETPSTREDLGPYLGNDSAFDVRLATMAALDRPMLILAFGGHGALQRREQAAAAYGDSQFATVIHPDAWVASSAAIEDGAVILAKAIVNSAASIGRHATINSGAIVEHDALIGSLAQVSPGAIVGGGSHIGYGAFLGLGAMVRDHVRVGDRATVAMGAVVVADVAAGDVVAGSPARLMDLGAES